MRRIGWVVVALALVLVAVTYGLEGPAVYDAGAQSYVYPHRPYRDGVLLGGLVLAAAALTAAGRSRSRCPGSAHRSS